MLSPIFFMETAKTITRVAQEIFSEFLWK